MAEEVSTTQDLRIYNVPKVLIEKIVKEQDKVLKKTNIKFDQSKIVIGLITDGLEYRKGLK